MPHPKRLRPLRMSVSKTAAIERNKKGRNNRRQANRPQSVWASADFWLLQRTQSQSARSTWYRRLCRTWTRSAPDSGKRKSWWTADATDAQKDRRRRLRNALPIEKASGGAGVRTDQTGTRFRQFLLRGVQKYVPRGDDLHHPQPPEAVRPRKGRLRRLPCNKCLAAMPIWTGS